MSEWTVRNGRDTWVNSAAASARHSDAKLLRLLNPGASTEYAYIWLRNPAPKGATIVSAQLHLFGYGADGLSATVTVQRLSARWSESQTDWNNKPGVTGATVSVTAIQSADAQEWVFDVSAILQTVTDLGPGSFYGLRISTTATTERKFYSLDATDNRPYLLVQWSDAPDAPINLTPSGGAAVSVAKPVLSYDYHDPNGSDLVSQQVQINPTNAFTAPAFDSGTVAADGPEYDTSTACARTATVNTTSASTSLTAAAGTFAQADVGATITGTGIPAGATITAVASDTAATLSAAATATGSPSATITRTYAGITAGSTAWWRSRVTNAAGKVSSWSDAVQFTRVNKVTVTLNNPSAAAPVVNDPTPEIAWTVTGGSQVARRVILRAVANADNTADPGDWLEDKGRVHTTATTYTPDAGVITDESATYEVELRTHDRDDRARTPGDPVYIQTIQQFTFTEDNTINRVTALAVAQDPSGLPAADVTWNDATFPDGYTIRRKAGDGSWRFLEHNIDPASTFVSGTAHSWTDWTAVPNVAYQYKVSRRVNKKLGPSDLVSFTYLADELWLTDVDTKRNVPLLVTDRTGGATQMVKADGYGKYRTLAGTVVEIWQGQSGLEGRVEALLTDYAGSLAGHWLANLMWMKVRPDNKLRFVFGGRNLHVTLNNLTDEPVPNGKADWRVVTFGFQSHDGPQG